MKYHEQEKERPPPECAHRAFCAKLPEGCLSPAACGRAVEPTEEAEADGPDGDAEE